MLGVGANGFPSTRESLPPPLLPRMPCPQFTSCCHAEVLDMACTAAAPPTPRLLLLILTLAAFADSGKELRPLVSSVFLPIAFYVRGSSARKFPTLNPKRFN